MIVFYGMVLFISGMSLSGSEAYMGGVGTATNASVIIHNHGTTYISFGGKNGAYLEDPAIGSPSLIRRMTDFVRHNVPHINAYMKENGVWDYVVENKWKLGAQAAVFAYCYVNYYLFSLGSYLGTQDRWIHWKPDCSLASLVHMPVEELITEMSALLRIRVKDINKQRDIPDIMKAVLEELDEELRAIERYSSFAHAIVMCDDAQRRCVVFCEGAIPPVFGIPVACLVRGLVMSLSARRLFYVNEDFVKSSSEWHHRLSYLKGIVEVYLDRAKCCV